MDKPQFPYAIYQNPGVKGDLYEFVNASFVRGHLVGGGGDVHLIILDSNGEVQISSSRKGKFKPPYGYGVPAHGVLGAAEFVENCVSLGDRIKSSSLAEEQTPLRGLAVADQEQNLVDIAKTLGYDPHKLSEEILKWS